MARPMSEEHETVDTDAEDKPGPVGEGIRTEPPGDPDVDDEAIKKGEETLERVKPY